MASGGFVSLDTDFAGKTLLNTSYYLVNAMDTLKL